MKNVLLALFSAVGVILAVSGGVFLIQSIRKLLEAVASKNWPSTPGKVVSSEVKQSERKLQSDSGPEKTVTVYEVHIRYEYSVKNVVFSGIDVSEGPSSTTDRAWAEARVAQFPRGKEMPVYYSPKDPTRSLLVPGFHSANLVPVAIAVVLIVTGVGMLVISRIWFGRT
jgi:hypothetical protein